MNKVSCNSPKTTNKAQKDIGFSMHQGFFFCKTRATERSCLHWSLLAVWQPFRVWYCVHDWITSFDHPRVKISHFSISSRGLHSQFPWLERYIEHTWPQAERAAAKRAMDASGINNCPLSWDRHGTRNRIRQDEAKTPKWDQRKAVFTSQWSSFWIIRMHNIWARDCAERVFNGPQWIDSRTAWHKREGCLWACKLRKYWQELRVSASVQLWTRSTFFPPLSHQTHCKHMSPITTAIKLQSNLQRKVVKICIMICVGMESHWNHEGSVLFFNLWGQRDRYSDTCTTNYDKRDAVYA